MQNFVHTTKSALKPLHRHGSWNIKPTQNYFTMLISTNLHSAPVPCAHFQWRILTGRNKKPFEPTASKPRIATEHHRNRASPCQNRVVHFSKHNLVAVHQTHWSVWHGNVKSGEILNAIFTNLLCHDSLQADVCLLFFWVSWFFCTEFQTFK